MALCGVFVGSPTNSLARTSKTRPWMCARKYSVSSSKHDRSKTCVSAILAGMLLWLYCVCYVWKQAIGLALAILMVALCFRSTLVRQCLPDRRCQYVIVFFPWPSFCADFAETHLLFRTVSFFSGCMQDFESSRDNKNPDTCLQLSSCQRTWASSSDASVIVACGCL